MFDPGLLHRPVTLIFRPVVDADPARFWALMRPEESQTCPRIAGVGNLLCSMQCGSDFPLLMGTPGSGGMNGWERTEVVDGWVGSGKEEIVVSY